MTRRTLLCSLAAVAMAAATASAREAKLVRSPAYHSGKVAFTKTAVDTSSSPSFKVTLGVVPDYAYSGEGMRIDGVSDGKPAAKAGLKAGDVVMKLGEHRITDMMSYMKGLGKFTKGEQTVVTVLREGKEQKFNVTW